MSTLSSIGFHSTLDASGADGQSAKNDNVVHGYSLLFQFLLCLNKRNNQDIRLVYDDSFPFYFNLNEMTKSTSNNGDNSRPLKIKKEKQQEK